MAPLIPVFSHLPTSLFHILIDGSLPGDNVCWSGLGCQAEGEATRRYKHFRCKDADIIPANGGPKEAHVAQHWVWKMLASKSRVP